MLQMPKQKYNIQTILDSLKPTLCGDKAEKVLPFLYQKLGFFCSLISAQELDHVTNGQPFPFIPVTNLTKFR